MQIQNMQVYRGRNIYSHKLVIKMTVDLEEHYSIPTKDIPGFNEILLEYIPGLKEQYSSVG